MARRRGSRPPRGKEIKAKFEFTPESLRSFERAMLELMSVADPEFMDEALLEGAEVVKAAQQRRAPGPFIEIELVKSVDNLKKGSATGLMKKDLSGKARYVAIGPDKKHWYYRFAESGVKSHGVKRKRTRGQQAEAKGKRRSDASKKKGRRPVMSWLQGGQRVFTRWRRGFAARPFVRASIDDNQAVINEAMAELLRKKIMKALIGG